MWIGAQHVQAWERNGERSEASFGLPRFAYHSSCNFFPDGDLNKSKLYVTHIIILNYSPSHGFWQSFVTIGSCNHLITIISTYLANTKRSEVS